MLTLSLVFSTMEMLKKRVLAIHITESATFAFLRVMETSRPVYGNIAFSAIQSGSTLHTSTGADAAEFEEAIKNGRIATYIVLILLVDIVVHVIWGHHP